MFNTAIIAKKYQGVNKKTDNPLLWAKYISKTCILRKPGQFVLFVF